ncbi:MAG TPA: RNA polymerase sigma factor [Polyangiaceae bacterium]|nr:RNA polymerase sigma factor [Polyangiaceae bacterium]
MKSRVADPMLRREVEAAVRRRVRGDEAEDVVQATLADVLSASSVPEEPEEFRRYVFGVARNKVFDHFRRQKRQGEDVDGREPHAPEPPLSARDILRWAEGELPDSESQSTLEWMLREGDGEKLEHIARDARLPATRVRKRVSRLRKLLRERWAAELMLIGMLILLGGLGVWYWLGRGRNPDDFVKREPVRPAPSAAPQAPQAPQPPEESRPAAPMPSAAPSADPGFIWHKGSLDDVKGSGTNPKPPAPKTTPRPTSTEMVPSPTAPAKPSPKSKTSISKKMSSDFPTEFDNAK